VPRPKVATEGLHALIARGLRVLAGATFPQEAGDTRAKLVDAKSARDAGARTRDARAGLLDRRSLLKLIKTESDRANRYAQPLSLGLIVVRELETIRADRGVESRDAVLRAYVKYMENGFRSCDVIARIATNQFVVVLPHTAAVGASGALDKLREATRGATIAAGNERMALPEFSGRALAYREKESADEFLARARASLNEMSAG
jgi:diguanylate cyclase (GGDEF)-like protein